jgi:hypothetical protein
MADFGIWSDAAGGFIAGPFYTASEADQALTEFQAEGEDDVEIIDWSDDEEGEFDDYVDTPADYEELRVAR